MRLFVALPVPPPVREHLALAVDAVSIDDPHFDPRRGPGPLRWVPENQRHITLAFYGEVPDGAVPALTADLRHALAGFAPLHLQLRGAGVFARRTLWIGVQEQTRTVQEWEQNEPASVARNEPASGTKDEGIVALMKACEDVGEQYARVERRDRHRAHLTLARTRRGGGEDGELSRRAHALSIYAGPPWVADHAELIVSELGAGKSGHPLHQVLEEIPLGAP